MSKIKTKSSVGQIYNFSWGGERLYNKKSQDKDSNKQTNKLVILKEFEPLFKKIAVKLFSDITNYTNTLECKYCHEEIQDTMEMNYFHLYTEDNNKFITFHFLCALKPDSILKFQDNMDRFDYISRTDDSREL